MRACILSADDEKGVLDIHQKIMKQYGFEVYPENRLPRIKKILEKNDIDCVHLDILFDHEAKVPDWDRPTGLSTMGEIARSNGKIPIMVISGYIDEKAKKMAEKYGLTDLIYKWYPKPADYEIIALDTIKAINEFKRKRAKDYVIKYIDNSDDERKIKASDAVDFIPILPEGIELKPNFLLDKLENLSYKILGKFEQSDVENFKEIVNEHVYEYFKNASINHSILAEYMSEGISEVDNEILCTKSAFELILAIIKKLRQTILHEEEISKARADIKDILNIRIGLKMKKPEDDRYLDLIELDNEEE